MAAIVDAPGLATNAQPGQTETKEVSCGNSGGKRMRSIQAGGLVTVLVSLALCAGPGASAQTPDKPASAAPAASPAPEAKPVAKKPAAAAQPAAKPAASLTFPVPGTKNLTYAVEADWGKCLPVNTAPAGVSIPERGGTLVVICVKNGVQSAKIVRVN
jgi:pyruvate/2-oxoglutarate dehydrogenase complex dihydrolipoamide acyltransferase (E2) component